jgi:pSer/pThr/pTyr-binding forkhead associated (FHA) protein
MSLSLKIFTRATGQSRLVSERVFEEERITVGRNTTCTLALDDPDRCLSRVHAELVKTGKGYMLKVLSGTSPVIVNGEPHSQGSEVMVRPGDTLAMDVYDLLVVSVAEAGPDPEATLVGRAPSATLAARVAAASRPQPADTSAAPGAPAAREAPAPIPDQGAGRGSGRKKWMIVGGAVVAGVVALALALPALKGLVPDSEAQKKAELRVAQLEGEARSLLKLVEGDRRDLKEAVAASKREIEKVEGQLRTARTGQERAPLEAALREAERRTRLNTALENKVRDQTEGPNGLPKVEGNLVAAATAAKGKDKAEAIKMLEETVAALTAVRAKIAEDRKLAQAEDERSRGELQSGAKAEADARTKMEIEARARAEAEVKARLEREARAKAGADAAKAAAKGAPPAEPQMSKAALAAQAAQEAKAAKAAQAAQAAQDAQAAKAARAAQAALAAQEAQAAKAAAAQAALDAKAAKAGQATKAAQDAAAAKAAQEAQAAKAAQEAQAAKAAQEAQAARAAQAAQAAQAAAAQVAASPCLAKLSGAWSHAVGGTWTFAGSQGTLAVNSSNYGASAQQITAINVSSCENDTVTYKVVRLALVNTDDPKLAYDKTPANEPALSTWAKVNTQRYTITASGLRLGNYTFAKR